MFSSPMLLDFNSNSKRSKITKACDNCRRRRVKCDGVSDGCSGCKAAKAQCIYTTSNTKRGPPKGYVEVIEDRLGKIENMLTNIVKKKTLEPQESSDKANASSSELEDNNDDDDHASLYSSDLVDVKMQPPASPVLHYARSITPANRSIRSGSTSTTPVSRHTPLVSRNRSLTSLLPFSQDTFQQGYPNSQADIAELTSMFDKLGTTSVRTTVPFPWLAPEQSRQYGRNYLQFTLDSLEPPLPILTHSTVHPTSPAVTLELLNSFFDTFNTFLPIVYQPTFMKQWQREKCPHCSPSSSYIATNQPLHRLSEAHMEHLQDPVAPLSPLLLNAVLAVAFKVPSDSEKNQDSSFKASTSSQAFFDNARLLLDEFLDLPRISTVQALCLMSQFHHHGQWKATRSSGYLSMAIRMAHELALNRDPEMPNSPEADALRYLWWSLFVLDHQFSTWSGLGLLMHAKESNVDLPLDQVSSEQRGFVCMVRLVKILGSVLQHSYSTQSLPPQFGGHDSMVSYIEGSLTSWLSNLAPDMRWQHPNGGQKRGFENSPSRTLQQQAITSQARNHSNIYPAYLYIVYNTTLILLHRPYIVGSAGSPAAAQSNTICTGSSRTITDIAQGLSIESCPYVVNRFALYALLQAGVIHAMNAAYDRRGSEAAMDYYKRTIHILQGFMTFTNYSGGVAEGIKILEQFLATTLKAASMAEDGEEGTTSIDQVDQNNGSNTQKKHQLETSYHEMNTAPTTSAALNQTPILTPATLSLAASSDTNGHPRVPFMMELNHHQQHLQQQQTIDIKEQQRLQQLKIQQQHRMYQALGAGAIKVEPSNDSGMQKLEQQQLQQQQIVRQQLQRQQQKQKYELEMKTHTTVSNSSPSQSHPASAPVIPSHRYALQMLQQQQQHQSHTPITMTMAMNAEVHNKMGQDFQMNQATNPSNGYDPQFWVDFSASDQMPSLTTGTISPAGLEHDALRMATSPENQSQFGGGSSSWM
ncbi:hypothetical protein BGZ76_001129 [Entomortierella beljakovae]|nr:hypothetical protein BGZ76_001129 [Entomortierella beljakovae]